MGEVESCLITHQEISISSYFPWETLVVPDDPREVLDQTWVVAQMSTLHSMEIKVITVLSKNTYLVISWLMINIRGKLGASCRAFRIWLGQQKASPNL